MDIEHIKCVLEVIASGSFSETADLLSCTQSSVSKWVNRVEDELGAKLFFRSSKYFELTPCGRIFVEYGQRIIDNYEILRNTIASTNTGNRPTLKLGMLPSVNCPVLPNLISIYSHKYPNYDLVIYEQPSASNIEMLIRGKLDLATCVRMRIGDVLLECYDHNAADLFSLIDLGSQRFYAVVPENHPYAKNNNISLVDLFQEQLIVPSANHKVYHDLLRQITQQIGITPSIRVAQTSLQGTLDFVRAEAGVTLMSFPSIPNIPGLKCVSLEEYISRETILMEPRGKRSSPAVNAFIGLIREASKAVLLES